ncbi:hypothetical protein [Arthrobacter sp. TWP1-1]|uniref:hypothetical protein n=1 Tax=Arthrobacter sp. TWP1-1 TaxID=2804568 RepID=UPI003CF1D31C
MAMMAGKFIGVFGETRLFTKTAKAELDAGLARIDVIGLRCWQGWASLCPR